MTDRKPLVGVTMGDPAGVGSEVIVKAAPDASRFARLVVIGDADAMREAVRICDADLEIEAVDAVDELTVEAGVLSMLDLGNVDDLEYGELREKYGRASLEYVERAIDLATAGEIDAIVTAPINKRATKLAGNGHAGHTGLLAASTDTDEYSMMLIEDDLRVSHVSTHVPLREACDLVTTERVLSTIRVTHAALSDLDIDEPTVAVAGLNPHASDGGLLGSEDDAEIRQAVERAREEGIDVHGPEPPDTVFSRAMRKSGSTSVKTVGSTK